MDDTLISSARVVHEAGKQPIYWLTLRQPATVYGVTVKAEDWYAAWEQQEHVSEAQGFPFIVRVQVGDPTSLR
eukprot:3352681-Prorocentrum_lima.AAC.1